MPRSNYDVKNRGQVFTPDFIVRNMLGLRKNYGRILEPSCAKGVFLRRLGERAVGIEKDNSLCEGLQNAICTDFFLHGVDNKYETIIGNPPYVRFQDIEKDTLQHLSLGLFDKRTNLYLFFIEKCISHLVHGGELIFITPRDFIKATSAKALNTLLYQEGSFTHFEDLGDKSIFNGYAPNCVIWRWEKGRKKKVLANGEVFHCKGGQIWFGSAGGDKVSNYFDVKVGAVSGADEIFSHVAGNKDFVCSKTRQTGETRRMIYNTPHAYLKRHKERLLKRRIRQFDEKNWWQWGRAYPKTSRSRIYVNVKTRQKDPFFMHDATAFDGSVLALFPKQERNLGNWLGMLNGQNWSGMGFVCGGRYLFTQRSLENAHLS